MIRLAMAGVAGAAAILGVTAFFLFAIADRAQGAECRGQALVASHYGKESGRRTADGSYFDGTQMVAAHRSWKFGTKLRVTYRGRSVNVTVRDRGPFIRGRHLDLSTAAAKRIGLDRPGVATVCVERIR
jgi:rare lipoprotein A